MDDLKVRATRQITLGKMTGSHTGSPNNIYQIADEMAARIEALEGAINGLRLDLETMPFGNKGGWLIRWHKGVLAKIDAILLRDKM